jgi:hypothetical protein
MGLFFDLAEIWSFAFSIIFSQVFCVHGKTSVNPLKSVTLPLLILQPSRASHRSLSDPFAIVMDPSGNCSRLRTGKRIRVTLHRFLYSCMNNPPGVLAYHAGIIQKFLASDAILEQST